MNTETQQQEWTPQSVVLLIDGAPKDALSAFGVISDAHNTALSTAQEKLRQRFEKAEIENERVLSKTYELHKAEIERLKADYARELNAKLEQINKQAETIRNERARRKTAEDIQHGEKLILVEEINENKLLSDRLLSALAAIERAITVFMAEGLTESGSNALWELRNFDFSELRKHDAEIIADREAHFVKREAEMRQQLLSALTAIEKHNKQNSDYPYRRIRKWWRHVL